MSRRNRSSSKFPAPSTKSMACSKYFEQAIDFVDGAGNFDDERFRRDIHDTRAENLDQFHQVRAILLIGRDFDQGKVSLEKRTSGDIFRNEDIDELFEAGFEAMRTPFIGMRHNGHAGDCFILRWPDRERIDIDSQPPGKGRDAIEDARFVFDISDKCLHVFSVSPTVRLPFRRADCSGGESYRSRKRRRQPWDRRNLPVRPGSRSARFRPIRARSGWWESLQRAW